MEPNDYLHHMKYGKHNIYNIYLTWMWQPFCVGLKPQPLHDRIEQIIISYLDQFNQDWSLYEPPLA